MMVVGLTGSIAMGKSEVARILAGEGIPVFDADREVHALYDSAAGTRLLSPFVPHAVVDGKVDRAVLSRLVLADPELLEKLEAVVHAEIARRKKAFIHSAEAAGHDIAIVDVPLLFEKEGHKDVDASIVVSAPLELQRDRALARPTMTREKLDMILKRQIPDQEKRRLATHVIENNGTLEDLRLNTLAVLERLRKNQRR